MQALIDEDKRLICLAEDDNIIEYPDERWSVIKAPADFSLGENEFIDYRWDGEQFVLDPKNYEEEQNEQTSNKQ